MAGSSTYAYPTHANTQEYCCATYVDYIPHRESPANCWNSWSPQSSRYRSAVGTFRFMVCVQTVRHSTRRWYAVRFEEGEEHAAAVKEESRTSEEAHSGHPEHATKMSCDSRTSYSMYAVAEVEDAVAAARRQGRPTGQDRTAEAQTFQRNAEERGASDKG